MPSTEIDPGSNVLPDGSMLIPGTEVPLETAGPVAPPKNRQKKRQQTETLPGMGVKETKPATRRETRPVRGALAGIADVQAYRREVETEISQTPLPDKPVGLEEAKQLLEEGKLKPIEDEEQTDPNLNGRAVDLNLHAQMRADSDRYGNNGSANTGQPKQLPDEELRYLLSGQRQPLDKDEK